MALKAKVKRAVAAKWKAVRYLKSFISCSLSLQLACGLLLSGFSFQSVAKEYSVETVLRAGAEYDDNVRLVEDKTDIAGLVVSPDLRLGVRTERLDLVLNTALDFARFNESEYNSDDQEIALTSSYAFEYNVFKATAQLKRDSTRTSEFLDTGEIGGRATRREAQNLSFAWQHLFTEKQSLELSASYATVEYASTNLSLNDYDYAGVNAAYSIALSDRTRLITQLVANRFNSDTFRVVQFGFDGIAIGADFFPADIQSDTYGMNVGIERILSEKLVFSIAVGANYSESSFDSRQADITSEQSGLDLLTGLEDEDDTSFFLSSTLRYSGERTTLNLSLSSNTNPSANGYLLLSNQLLFNADYRLSERSKVFGTLDIVDSGSLGDTVDSAGRSLDSNDRTYGSASVGASYRLTEAWYVEASYRYRAQDREFFDDIAKSNAAFIKIVYQPHKKTWSR